MNREQLDQWDFVIASYAIGVVATLLMVAWAVFTMMRAEQRRDAVKRQTAEEREQ